MKCVGAGGSHLCGIGRRRNGRPWPPSAWLVEIHAVGAHVARRSPRGPRWRRLLPVAGDPRVLDPGPVPVSCDPHRRGMRRGRPLLDHRGGRRAADDDGARRRRARHRDAPQRCEARGEARPDQGANERHTRPRSSRSFRCLSPTFAHVNVVFRTSPFTRHEASVPSPGGRRLSARSRSLSLSIFYVGP
jgi:hypothetical protein